MHAGTMATTQKYLTFRGLAGAVATVVLDRFACLRKGHDPVLADRDVVCRRCLGILRR